MLRLSAEAVYTLIVVDREDVFGVELAFIWLSGGSELLPLS
jgi:hypothetical protein